MLKFLARSVVLFTAVSSVSAATVSLESPDGQLSVNGEVIGSDDENVTIQSEFGIVNFPPQKMNCVSGDCDTGINWANATNQVVFALSDVRDGQIIELLSKALDRHDAFAVAQSPLGRGEEGLKISEQATGANMSVQLLRDRDGAQTYLDVTAPQDTAETVWGLDIRPTAQLIGVGALSVVVHSDVKIEGLSPEQLAQIYAGEITNWSELGGPDQTIVALKRAPGTADLSAFENAVMAPFGKEVAPSVLAVAADDKIAKFVSDFPGGLGVVDARLASAENTIPLTSQCGGAIYATDFNVASGDYPLLRATYAVHQGEANSLTTALFDSATQSYAQTELAQLGLNAGAVTQLSKEAKTKRLEALMAAELSDDQKDEAQALVELMFVSNRLSTTFFAGELTAGRAAWNRAQMLRLSAMFESGEYAGYELVFAGFSKGASDDDASGVAATQALNAFKSVTEANTIANAIRLTARGYGAVGASGCVGGAATGNDDYRVEVWVRKADTSG